MAQRTVSNKVVATTASGESLNTYRNGRPQVLSNGWIVNGVMEGSDRYLRLYVDKHDGRAPVLLVYMRCSNTYSMAHIGTTLYVVADSSGSQALFYKIDVLNQTPNQLISPVQTISSNNSRYDGGMDLVVNASCTELHYAESVTSNSYPNSYNIKYNRGNIDKEGNVSWGSVTEVTTFNTSGVNAESPSISFNSNGMPIIAVEYSETSKYCIMIMTNEFTTKDLNITNMSSQWGCKVIRESTKSQNPPSAIFVPSEINGLSNGRIWVGWGGGTDSNPVHRTWYSFSDDKGITWSKEYSITTTSGRNSVSLTADKNNVIYAFIRSNSTDYTLYLYKLLPSKSDGSSFSLDKTYVKGANLSPAFDLSIDVTEPIFVYKDSEANKVIYQGDWFFEEVGISEPEDNIGVKYSGDSILSYAITTDGEMSNIIEKVNGVVVNTRTALSGEELNLSLSEKQWGDVEFGRYGKHTIDNLTTSNTYDWRQGTWSTTSWVVLTSTVGLVYRNYSMTCEYGDTFELSVNDGFSIRVFVVSDDNKYSSSSYATTSSYKVSRSGTSRVFIAVKKADDSTITAEDIVLAQPKVVLNSTDYNTVSIKMDSKEWFYTFSKGVDTDSSLSEVAKAVKDTKEVYLPTIKQLLVGKVNGSYSDSFEEVIKKMNVKNWSSGSLNWSTGSTSSTLQSNYTVSGLSFIPSMIVAQPKNHQVGILFFDGSFVGGASPLGAVAGVNSITVSGKTFKVGIYGSSGYNLSGVLDWYAFE